MTREQIILTTVVIAVLTVLITASYYAAKQGFFDIDKILNFINRIFGL